MWGFGPFSPGSPRHRQMAAFNLFNRPWTAVLGIPILNLRQEQEQLPHLFRPTALPRWWPRSFPPPSVTLRVLGEASFVRLCATPQSIGAGEVQICRTNKIVVSLENGLNNNEQY